MLKRKLPFDENISRFGITLDITYKYCTNPNHDSLEHNFVQGQAARYLYIELFLSSIWNPGANDKSEKSNLINK